MLLARHVLRDASVEQVDLVAERRVLRRHRLDARDGFLRLLVLDLGVVDQPPILFRQGSADGGVEQFLFDLRMDAQHLADAPGERVELLGCGARELGEQLFGESVIAPEHAERIGGDVVGIVVEGSGASAGHLNVLGSVCGERRALSIHGPPWFHRPVRYHSPMTATPRLSKYLRGVHCFACETSHDPRTLLGVCQRCGMPLRVDYDLGAIRLKRSDLASRAPTLWRYRELLPLEEGDETSLGEGFTPLLAVAENVWVKDEARNPTGSFKARGMALAVSMAKHLGAKKFSAPSAGNAAGALAAYGARAGLPVVVAMPADTPKPFFDECTLYGATIHRVQGTIADAGKFLREHGPKDAYDVSTLREPYRIEGKKTMAYELVEQFDGEVPDVVLYPTGGGTGLVGMWKAFDEMAALGWIPRDQRPRFVSVQAAGCAPVAKAFHEGAERTEAWQNAQTRAYGLRVPSPLGGFICLRALRETHGTAIAIEEEEMQRATFELAARSGIDICPEGGAAWAALAQLRKSGFVRPSDRVIVFNTGTGLKYR